MMKCQSRVLRKPQPTGYTDATCSCAYDENHAPPHRCISTICGREWTDEEAIGAVDPTIQVLDAAATPNIASIVALATLMDNSLTTVTATSIVIDIINKLGFKGLPLTVRVSRDVIIELAKQMSFELDEIKELQFS